LIFLYFTTVREKGTILSIKIKVVCYIEKIGNYIGKRLFSLMATAGQQ